MENMEIWDKVKRPPGGALKTIMAGRLKGKSDINPQWRMQIMTEMFGPCGAGWHYVIERLWTEPGIDGQVFAFAEIMLYFQGGSNGVPGIGGSMLIAKEQSGLHHNDEAFKMATTDALSVAMKALGVAADIYLGLFDGSKYSSPSSTLLPVTPNSGAGDDLSTNQRNLVADAAIAIKDAWGVDDKDKALNLFLELKNEEKMYLWTLLDSKIRNPLKAYGKEKEK